MTTRFLRQLLAISAFLLVLPPLVANAERQAGNEPGREPGVDRAGLLRIDPLYFGLSAATGGDFYFWARGEFAAAAGKLTVPPLGAEPVTLAYVSRGGPFARTFDIPVDGTISQLSIFAGAQRLDDLVLLRPDGQSSAANSAGVSVQSFRHMRIITVDGPEPGLWQVTVSGSGGYELASRCLSDQNRLRAQGLQAIELISFDFVVLGGRPGHQGYFSMKAVPAAGTEQMCRVTVSGGIDRPVVELVAGDGALIGPVASEEKGEVAADEFLCRCRVPAQPFRVRVRGKDRQGWPFERITPDLITPKSSWSAE